MKCKLFIFWLGTITAASVIAGCVRDGDNISNPVEVVLTVDAPTRTGLSDGGEIVWSEGDCLGVFAYSRSNPRWEFGNNSCFELTEADGTYGVFKGNLYLGAYIEPDEIHEITYHA